MSSHRDHSSLRRVLHLSLTFTLKLYFRLELHSDITADVPFEMVYFDKKKAMGNVNTLKEQSTDFTREDYLAKSSYIVLVGFFL